MTETSGVVALIPARAGSKRLPNKNMYPFHGKPLAAWTLELARGLFFDRIVVSTDDEPLRTLASPDPAFTVRGRPAKLGNDTATILDVIRHVADEQALREEDVVVLLQVTAPLRVASDVTEALRLFEAHGRRRTVVSVSESTYPPALLWRIGADGGLESFLPQQGPAVTRKQDHGSTYFWNDVVLVDSVANFRRPGRNLFSDNPVPLVIPRERGVAIDYPVQMTMAQALFPPRDERLSQ
ncbi:MAG: acylneuraminate cytidylyltransferase family protein [Alphaproteobacteria bacterium]|nr:acylneuraminate cytidylyltransferase family protein [Alphaproteobacteria bacterium]